MKNLKKVAALILAMIMVIVMVPDTASAASKKLKVNKSSLTLYTGGVYTLKTTGYTKNLKWSSSDKNVATVSSKGVVTAKKSGKATITVKYGSKTAKCKVTVKSATLSLTKTDVSVNTGKKITLKTKGIKKDLKWTSSNKKVATVNNKGVVTGKKAGSTTITVKYGKQSAKCVVHVSEAKAMTVINKMKKADWLKKDNLSVKCYLGGFSEEFLFYDIGMNKKTKDSIMYMRFLGMPKFYFEKSTNKTYYYDEENGQWCYYNSDDAAVDEEEEEEDIISDDVTECKLLGKKKFNGTTYNALQVTEDGGKSIYYYDNNYNLVGAYSKSDSMESYLVIDVDTVVEVPQKVKDAAIYKEYNPFGISE